MQLYFAYGSNMMRARLERRVGTVEVLGRARIDDYSHSFSKRGADGTGKGNITMAGGHVVHGVLYRLTITQIERLSVFEGGYRQITVSALHDHGPMDAATFQALKPVGPLRPSLEYLAYYQRGMVEHDLPPAYRELVLEQARLEQARLDQARLDQPTQRPVGRKVKG